MFALFFSLYLAMFIGKWQNFTLYDISQYLIVPLNKIGEILTSIFGDFQVTDFGETMMTFVNVGGSSVIYYYQILIAFILALITCIGIVVMAVKGVKKAFGIFFMGVNRL